MEIAEALFSFLSGNATIHAAVADRIYPMVLPQGASLPALTYRELFSTEEHALQADDTLQRPTFEIECHGLTYLAARTTMKTVKNVLKNFTGTMGDATVQAILVSGGGEDYNPENNTYWKSKEFELFIEEA